MSKEIVLDVLMKENKAMKNGEIAQIIGIDEKKVAKFVKELQAEEKVFSPKRCYYQVK